MARAHSRITNHSSTPMATPWTRALLRTAGRLWGVRISVSRRLLLLLLLPHMLLLLLSLLLLILPSLLSTPPLLPLRTPPSLLSPPTDCPCDFPQGEGLIPDHRSPTPPSFSSSSTSSSSSAPTCPFKCQATPSLAADVSRDWDGTASMSSSSSSSRCSHGSMSWWSHPASGSSSSSVVDWIMGYLLLAGGGGSSSSSSSIGASSSGGSSWLASAKEGNGQTTVAKGRQMGREEANRRERLKVYMVPMDPYFNFDQLKEKTKERSPYPHLTSANPYFWLLNVPRFNSCDLSRPAAIRMPEAPAQSKILWRPARRRYLLALCTQGQASNRKNCIHISMVHAALLNRTLILPWQDFSSPRTRYNFDIFFDRAHARTCLGDERTIVSVEEYLAQRNKTKVAVRMLCLKPQCHVIDGPSCLHVQSIVPQIVVKGGKCPVVDLPLRSRQRFVEEMGKVKDEVITFGDVIWASSMAGVPRMLEGNGPFQRAPGCAVTSRPDPALLQAAESFVRLVLGASFAAIHLRRGDFHWYCTVTMLPCSFPLRQLAECAVRRLAAAAAAAGGRGARVRTVFLATNALPEEVEIFTSAMNAMHDSKFVFVSLTLPSGAPWTDDLQRKGWATDSLAISTLEKLISAMGKVFLASLGSTFSLDIFRLRLGLGLANCLDDYICGAEQPEKPPITFGPSNS